MVAQRLHKVKFSEMRRRYASLSLELFVRTYLSHHTPLAVPGFHRELYELFDLPKNPDRILRLLDIEPRGYGKSIRWGFFLPLWQLVASPYGVSERIAIVSNTATLAERNLRWAMRELESNAYLKADFGDLLVSADVSRVDMLELRDGRSIMAKGVGAQIRGFHPTQVIGDDLENREDAKNPELRAKLEEYLQADLLGALEPGSALFLIGTIVHDQGLLATLERNDTDRTKGWIKKKFAAITDSGDALWPEKESLADLERLKQEMSNQKRGTAIFYQEKLNIAVPTEEMAISPEDIRYVDYLPCSHQDMAKTMACDLAFSAKKSACYSAFVTLGTPFNVTQHTGSYFAVSVKRGRWGRSLDKANAFLREYLTYRPDVIVIEDGPGIVDFIGHVQTLAGGRNIVLPQIRVVKPKIDKLARAQTISHLFEEGRVYFQNHPLHREMAQELVLLPNGDYSDMADACVHGLKYHRHRLRSGLFDEPVRPEVYVGVGGY